MKTDNIGMSSAPELVLKPHKGWQPVDFQEIWQGRELFAFLVWRDIKIRYKQTVLGGMWALFQPLLAMLIFTVVFGRLAGIRTDGPLIRSLLIRAWCVGPFLQILSRSRAIA